jgi:phage antirepressor YoqD-like protein
MFSMTCAHTGRFVIKAGVSRTSEHAYNTAKFTPKGVEWIAGEWAKHQVRQPELI